MRGEERAVQPSDQPVDAFGELPNPGRAASLDDLAERLRLLKIWAGDPSYEWITGRVNTAWRAGGRPATELAGKATVASCFRPGRRRLNPELVAAVVAALHPDVGYVAQWRQALQVVGGTTQAAGQVRVQDWLPPDLAGFTGRTGELDRLHRALNHDRPGAGVMVISAIEGMAGVGKTQLAIHAGHHLARQNCVDRVLFVNLRGFHPDPAQPPADPGAVLDGFLRLLGVPGQQIPHDLTARAAVYRDRLAGTRTLVLLDNAADAEQVEPLLPHTPGCPVLVTSRRDLIDLHPAAHLTVDVFTPDEARQYMTRVAPEVPVGDDPDAAARIAARCGHLPLALGLVAGHIRAKPGWTLTDHADRLDEHHRHGRLDAGIQAALDLSYQHLPADQQRLLRLAALHPGQDFDTYAAAALADTDLHAAHTRLHDLHRDHLLQQTASGRYTFHDLVRAYATTRAVDDDPPPERRNALTRLFDYYVATAATAMNTLHPAEAHRRPHIPPPATPTPDFTEPDTALAWLDTERPTLVAVAAHTARDCWPTHTVRLSTTLFRYLSGGHHTDARTVHNQALHAAHHADDLTGQAQALTHLGTTLLRLGRNRLAADHLRQALHLFRQAKDLTGQACALTNLGDIDQRLGHYQSATEHHGRALILYRNASDRAGEAHALTKLGIIQERLGRYLSAIEYHEQALTVFRRTGDDPGEAAALSNLGDAEGKLSRYGLAVKHLEWALTLYRQTGNVDGEAWTLDNLGALCSRRHQNGEAVQYHQQAVSIHRETGERYGEACALNGLGEAAYNASRAAEAITHHTAANTIAADIGDRHQQARANTGLGHAHHSTGNPGRARYHFRSAWTLYTRLGTPEADQIQAHLAVLDGAYSGQS
jgi:tetratricopeptide (TPR) repeat protein